MSGLLKMVLTGGGNPASTAHPHFEAGIALAATTSPKVLIVPSAAPTSNSSRTMGEDIRSLCGRHGLSVRFLHNFSGKMPAHHEISRLLGWADVVCIIDGDTTRLMNIWRDIKLTQQLTHAALLGEVVVIGLGSGMMAWFDEGLSSSEMYVPGRKETWEYRPVGGTQFFSGAVACPRFETSHPRTRVTRASAFRDMLRGLPIDTIGIGMDTTAALRINDGEVAVLSSDGEGSLYHHVTVSPSEVSVRGFKPGAVMPLRELFTVSA